MTKTKKWKAIYLPKTDSGGDPSKGGFTSYEEAYKWVEETCYCDYCKLELEEMAMNPEYDGYLPCGGEWDIEQE